MFLIACVFLLLAHDADAAQPLLQIRRAAKLAGVFPTTATRSFLRSVASTAANGVKSTSSVNAKFGLPQLAEKHKNGEKITMLT